MQRLGPAADWPMAHCTIRPVIHVPLGDCARVGEAGGSTGSWHGTCVALFASICRGCAIRSPGLRSVVSGVSDEKARARRPTLQATRPEPLSDPLSRDRGVDRHCLFSASATNIPRSLRRRDAPRGTTHHGVTDPEELPGTQELREAQAGHRDPEPDRHPEA